MDRSFIEIGVVCCSLSGDGIGEKVLISSYDAYEPKIRVQFVNFVDELKADWKQNAIDSASRKQVVSQGRTDCARNKPASPVTRGEAS